MRSGMFGKLMAVLLAVMLVLPVAAQADDLNNEYMDVTISDLVVNYAGTEFDFSGIDLTLAAGVDAENRIALGGLVARLDSSGNGAGLVAQLNEDDALLMLGNQLLKVPYANMGETLSKLGVANATQLGDITEQMELFWASLAEGANAENSFEKLLEQYANTVNENELTKQINAMMAEAVPEQGKFTVDGVEYDGQKISISLSDDMLNELVASEAMQEYYASMAAILNNIFAQAGLTYVDVNGTSMPIDEFVSMMMSSASSIKYAGNITVDFYFAPYDDEKSVVLMDYSPMTLDMSEYMALLSSVDESAATIQSSITVDESIAMIGKLDENFDMDPDSVEYVEIDAKVSNPADGDESISMNVKGTDRDDEGSFSMNIDVPQTETSAAASMVVAADWSDKDDAQAVNAKLEVYAADVQQAGIVFTGNSTESDSGDKGEYTLNISDATGTNATVSLSYNYAESDDDTAEGNITLQLDDGTTGLMPVGSIDYTTTKSGDDDAELTEVVFSANAMGMVTASGKLTLREMPMGAEMLPSEGAIDLSTADAEELQAVLTNLQTNLQSLLIEAMNVPGVQQVMTMMQGSLYVDEVVTEAPDDDAIEEVIPSGDVESDDMPIAG